MSFIMLEIVIYDLFVCDIFQAIMNDINNIMNAISNIMKDKRLRTPCRNFSNFFIKWQDQ